MSINDASDDSLENKLLPIFNKRLTTIPQELIHLGKNVVIEEGAIIGYDFNQGKRGDYKKDIYIGDGTIIKYGSIICPGTVIGKNCMINNYVMMRECMVIGDNTVIGPFTQFEGYSEVGSNTLIYSQCHITARAKIGNHVFIAPFFVGANDNKMRYHRPQLDDGVDFQGPTICDGARIACGVIVGPGVRIGKEAVVGLGAVVLKDVPDGVVVIGLPARAKMYVDSQEYIPNAE